MSFDLWVTLITLLGAVMLFATEKLPVDIVALLSAAVLLITGVVTVEEGIAGFSNPAVIIVGCMFVLSSALQRTGALDALGRLLAKSGGRSPGMFCMLVMLCVVPVSAFVNNTAACDDGNPCTLNDACSAGACRPRRSSAGRRSRRASSA